MLILEEWSWVLNCLLRDNIARLVELFPEGGEVAVADLIAKGAVRDNAPVKVLLKNISRQVYPVGFLLYTILL